MAVIDLTLESFLIPAIPNYVSNRFGTKKQSGGLSTQEVNDNMMMPWVRSRPIEISASSTTKASTDAKAPVQADCNFVFTAEQSVSFMLDDADYIGCRATFHNTSAYTQTVSSLNKTDPNSPSYDTHTVLEGDRIVLVWNGTAWQNISPVDTIADGNLNPVTSNAVANAMSYSKTETPTGGKWIDGKPIYRKVVEVPMAGTDLPNTPTTWENLLTNQTWVADVETAIHTDFYGHYDAAGTEPRTANIFLRIKGTTILYFSDSVITFKTRKFYINFEYTKKSD